MKTFLLTIIISLIAINVSTQTIIHVPGDYSTIQTAINASVNGDTILVQPGTYVERINFNGKNIVVGSTYMISNDTSLISSTIIDGNHLPNVVTFNNNENFNTKLLGFTIQNGFYNGGSYIYNGAGILIDGASPEISNCIIKDNYISWYGGGICIKNGSEALLNSLIIRDNHSDAHGGGIAILSANPKMFNLVIINNSTGIGWGGGIYIASNTSPEIINCTIINNSAFGYSSHYGGGISTTAGSEMIVLNSIIWNNTPNQIDDEFNQIQPVFYSNIQGGYTGTGNISEDPKFLNSSLNDYRISDYSPSIGAGIDSLLYSGIWFFSPNTDLELNPRPYPAISNPDQGAYENSYGTPQHKTLVLVPGDYATIQEAINEVIDGDTILVLPGNYNENINFNNKNILLTSNALYNRDSLIVNQTKIIAQSILYPVIIMSSGRLLGFSVQGGNGGISVPIYSTTQIDFCSIHNNISVGIGASNSQIEILDCKIFNNLDIGVSLLGCIGSLKTSRIYGNNGSGLHLWAMSGNFEIENNLFFSNIKGISTFGQNPASIINCTIYGNDYGIFCQEGSAFNIKNSILFNTGTPILINNGGIHILEIDYTIIENGEDGIVNNSTTSIITYGDHNINYNPLFTNANNYDFHLSEFSPGIGSGTSVGAPLIDIEGNPRPNPAGSDLDIGAYESPLAHFNLLPPVLFSIANGSINQSTNIQLNWYPVYAATSYRFQLSTDSTFQTVLIDQQNITDTLFSISSLNYLTTYYWRVNASYTFDISDWSDVWNFTTIIEEPEIPVLNLPANHSINLPLSIFFKWNISHRAENYKLQISSDSLFTNIIYQDSLIADTSKIVSGFNNNTQYYWRVRAKNIGGLSNYSNTWKFKTILQTTTLLSPPNNSANVSNNPTFSWDAINGSTKYHLQISLNSSFSQIVIEDSLITNTSVQKGPLNFSTTYYWRVRGYDSSYTSLFSDYFAFTTIMESPETPILLSPANNTFNHPNNINFSWSLSLRAEKYEFQTATDSLFQNIVFQDTSLIDTSVSVSGLSFNNKYFWRVRAKNIGGYSSFSTIWNFRTKLQTPILQSPTNNSQNISINPTLSWSTVAGAANYHLQVALDPGFNQLEINDSLLTTSSTQIGPLEHNTTYYWRVKAYNGNYISDFSSGFNFTTIIENPNFPVLLSPVNGAVNQPLNTVFSWEAVTSATSYRLQISIDSLFGSFVFNDSTITTTSKLVNLPNSNQKYFWRVQAKNVGGYGPFSDVWYLITILPAPALTSITPGNKQIQITWNQIPVSNLLQHNIYRDVTPNPTQLISSVPSTQYSFSDSGLFNGVAYYYRVKSVSTYGVESDYSNQLSVVPFNSPPVAALLSDVFLPNEGRVLNKQLIFSSAGSSDPDGTIDTIKWFVNNEFVTNSTDLVFSFPQGTFDVSLVVIDNDGQSDTSRASVTRSMFRKIVNGQVKAGLSLIGTDILYAVVSGDAVYKMNKDGDIDYTLQVGGNVLSSSSIANDSSVYIGSTDNNIYAFSKFGTSLWVRPLGGSVIVTPTIDLINNRIYVGVSNRNFQFLDRSNGTVIGNFFSDAPINTSAVITFDNKLFFSTSGGTMYGFDLTNLTFPNVTPDWIIQNPDTITTSPAIDEEGFFYVGTKNGLLKKISMQSGLQGTIVWQANLGGSITASPIIDANGNLYIGSSNTKFFSLEKSNGAIKWSYNFGGPIKTTAAISDQSRIYFGTDNGYIYCVDTMGTQIWKYRDSAAICSALLHSENSLYMGTIGGRLVAIFDSISTNYNSLSSNNIWATFQGNNQRTGEQSDRITELKEELSNIPKDFSLFDNFPNPFNSSTTIRYAIPYLSQVKVDIFNILGENVKNLINVEQTPGYYDLSFDASSLASGVYIYRIVAISKDQKNQFTKSKKMILMK